MKLTKNGILRIYQRSFTDNAYRIKCNFNCSYCISNNMKVKQISFNKSHFLQTKLIWDRISKLDDKILAQVNFHGEFLIDKWGRKCAFYINKIPNVKVFEILTNNSVSPKIYLNEMDLKKSVFLCSFHPDSITLEKFINHCIQIKEAGGTVFSGLVFRPQIIKNIRKIHLLLKKNHIPLILQPFHTFGFKYYGKQYPQDYTEKERQLLKKYINYEEYHRFSVDLQKTIGLDCHAGVDSIQLFLDGTVRRCFTGNIGRPFKKKVGIKNLINAKFGLKINTLLRNNIIRNLIAKIEMKYRNDTSIFDLISGRVRLAEKPYPCHTFSCFSNTLFMHLNEFRKKYPFPEYLIDNYELLTINEI